MNRPDLYLASQSPRRRELLAQIGVRFEVLSVSVPEVCGAEESPKDYILRLSREKAEAGVMVLSAKAAGSGQEDCPPVLGADTIVLSEGQLMEKPLDETDAVRMLCSLAGKTHWVMTAVAVTRARTLEDSPPEVSMVQAIVETAVTFRGLSADDAGRYWQTGEPRDKAGAYGIQGFGAVFVESIRGSYSNIVGLPLMEVSQLLDQVGVPVWSSSH